MNKDFKKGFFIGSLKISLIVIGFAIIIAVNNYYGTEGFIEYAEDGLKIQEREFIKLQMEFENRKNKANLEHHNVYSEDVDCKIINLNDNNFKAKCQEESPFNLYMKTISWSMKGKSL